MLTITLLTAALSLPLKPNETTDKLHQDVPPVVSAPAYDHTVFESNALEKQLEIELARELKRLQQTLTSPPSDVELVANQ